MRKRLLAGVCVLALLLPAGARAGVPVIDYVWQAIAQNWYVQQAIVWGKEAAEWAETVNYWTSQLQRMWSLVELAAVQVAAITGPRDVMALFNGPLARQGYRVLPPDYQGLASAGNFIGRGAYVGGGPWAGFGIARNAAAIGGYIGDALPDDHASQTHNGVTGRAAVNYAAATQVYDQAERLRLEIDRLQYEIRRTRDPAERDVLLQQLTRLNADLQAAQLQLAAAEAAARHRETLARQCEAAQRLAQVRNSSMNGMRFTWSPSGSPPSPSPPPGASPPPEGCSQPTA
jgi:hypothetical protein